MDSSASTPMWDRYLRIPNTIVRLSSVVRSGVIASERWNSLTRADSKRRHCHCDSRSFMATFNLSYGVSDGSSFAPSAWEKFIGSAGFSESICASLVAGGTREGSAIRSWVLANYTRRYVPEHILDALGLRRHLALKRHAEERESPFSLTTDEAPAHSSTNDHSLPAD